MNRWRKALISLGLGAYLVGMGMLAGVVIDRMWYDQQRSEVLGRYEQALRDWHTYRMELEKHADGQR